MFLVLRFTFRRSQSATDWEKRRLRKQQSIFSLLAETCKQELEGVEKKEIEYSCWSRNILFSTSFQHSTLSPLSYSHLFLVPSLEMQSKFRSPRIIISQPIFFLSPKNVVGCLLNRTMVREYHIHTWERNAGPAVCPWAKGSLYSVVDKAGSSLSAHLGLYLRGKCSHFGQRSDHKSNWSQLEQTALLPILNRCIPPPHLFEDKENWKFESGG